MIFQVFQFVKIAEILMKISVKIVTTSSTNPMDTFLTMNITKEATVSACDQTNRVGDGGDGTQKRKRGWPKGKPRGPKKKQKVETPSVIVLSDDDSPVAPVTTPPPQRDAGKSETESKSKAAPSSSPAEGCTETVKKLQSFILKRMHYLYKFKSKLEEMQKEESLDDNLAFDALSLMENYLLKNLNRIREYKEGLRVES